MELKKIEYDEYIKLVNENRCALGIVINRLSGNVIAFGYVREGITYYYKVVDKE